MASVTCRLCRRANAVDHTGVCEVCRDRAEPMTLERLVAERRAELVRFVARYSYRADEVEEIVQDVLVIAARRRDAVESATGWNWLLVVARREAWRTIWRRIERERRLVPLAARHALVGPAAADPIATLDMRAAIQALRPDERSALGDRAAGFTYAESAQRRGWTYTKVNRATTEGRAALRKAMA